MKKIVAILALLCVTVLSPTAISQKIKLPHSTRHTLENGLTVILMEYRKVPVIHFRLVVRGGSGLDSGGFEGVASLTAAVMREGTENRTATDIAKAIDFVGGSLSVSAGADYCAAAAEVLKKDLDTGLELLADVVLHPSFPGDEIEREVKQRLAALEALKEEPASVASLAFTKTVYGTHPYGRQMSGTKTSLEAIGRQDLVDFFRRVFNPENATLAVVGDFTSAEMLEKVSSAFREWQKSEKPTVTLPRPEKIRGRQLLLVNKPDATQTQIILGNIGIDIRDPDRFALQVANTIFGAGFTSRLIDELRVKRSLTYGASSAFPASLWGGSYVISTFTKNSTVTEAVDVVLTEIRKYRASGASAEELRKGQNYIAGNFARNLQLPEVLAMRLTDIEIYGFPADYLETYLQKIRGVTLDDVSRVVRKHFLLDDMLLVFVAPAGDIAETLRKYGEVKVAELGDVVQ